MMIPWDADILVFAWTMMKIVFTSKKRLRAANRAIAVHDDLEAVPEGALSQTQKNYLQPFDAQLAALNYSPDCTYRVTNHRNLGKNLLRHYSNPADRASCQLIIVEIKVKVETTESVKTSASVSFTTWFHDGKVLTTRNMSLKSLLDRPPYAIRQECRHVTSLTELKKRHDARAAKMGMALPAPAGVDAVFAAHHKEHERFSNYQLQQGTYRLLPDGQAYELTDKVHARGIWNHYNPFAKRISPPPAILAALVGSVLPLYAILKVAPWIATQTEGSPATLLPITSFAICLCYILAGAIIGLVSENASYQWIMLISYVPAHFVAGWNFGWWPYSTAMFLTSFYTNRARRRSALIFES